MSWNAVYRTLWAPILCIWIGSLCFPSYATPIEEINGPGSALQIDVSFGWQILLVGWVTIFEGKFAWLANPVLLWWVARLASGGPKSQTEAAMGCFWAFSALFFALIGLRPTHISMGDDHGVNGLSYPLLGAYVWVASIAGLLAAMTASVVVNSPTGGRR